MPSRLELLQQWAAANPGCSIHCLESDQVLGMKQILLRYVISIDEQDFTAHSCDYSESINELIRDEILEDDNQEIIDHILQDS